MILSRAARRARTLSYAINVFGSVVYARSMLAGEHCTLSCCDMRLDSHNKANMLVRNFHATKSLTVFVKVSGFRSAVLGVVFDRHVSRIFILNTTDF